MCRRNLRVKTTMWRFIHPTRPGLIVCTFMQQVHITQNSCTICVSDGTSMIIFYMMWVGLVHYLYRKYFYNICMSVISFHLVFVVGGCVQVQLTKKAGVLLRSIVMCKAAKQKACVPLCRYRNAQGHQKRAFFFEVSPRKRQRSLHSEFQFLAISTDNSFFKMFVYSIDVLVLLM